MNTNKDIKTNALSLLDDQAITALEKLGFVASKPKPHIKLSKLQITQELIDEHMFPEHMRPGILRIIIDARPDRTRPIMYAFGPGGRLNETEIAGINDSLKDTYEYITGKIDEDFIFNKYGGLPIDGPIEMKSIRELEQYY